MKIELFYTLSCPNCKTLEKLLNQVLPEFNEFFELKKTLANSPKGYFKTLKLGIHSVTTLLINNEIVFRNVPEKNQLKESLTKFKKNA